MWIFIFVWNYQLGFLVILIQKFHYNQQETYLPELKISAFIQQWADRVFQEVFSELWMSQWPWHIPWSHSWVCLHTFMENGTLKKVFIQTILFQVMKIISPLYPSVPSSVKLGHWPGCLHGALPALKSHEPLVIFIRWLWRAISLTFPFFPQLFHS